MTDYAVPAWVAALAAVVTLVGGALLALAVKARKSVIELKSQDSKVTLEQQRGQSELDIHITDQAVARWQAIAENAVRRKDQLEDEFYKRLREKDDDAEKRIQNIVTYWQNREKAAMEQSEKRELQFSEILDEVRAKYENALLKNAELSGELTQTKRDLTETRRDLTEVKRDLTEVKARVESQSARQMPGGRRREDPPS